MRAVQGELNAARVQPGSHREPAGPEPPPDCPQARGGGESLREGSDVPVREACARLGAELGLNRPVSEQVLRAVMEDDTYARYLMASRRAPAVLESLLARPPAPRTSAANGPAARTAAPPAQAPPAVGALVPEAAAAPTPGALVTDGTTANGEPRTAEAPGTPALVAEATAALFRWGRSGFGRVDEEAYRRRFGACEACEHLVAAPDAAVYRIALAAADDKRICRVCGCGVAAKARLRSESCPLPDPGDATRTRWGEPRST